MRKGRKRDTSERLGGEWTAAERGSSESCCNWPRAMRCVMPHVFPEIHHWNGISSIEKRWIWWNCMRLVVSHLFIQWVPSEGRGEERERESEERALHFNGLWNER